MRRLWAVIACLLPIELVLDVPGVACLPPIELVLDVPGIACLLPIELVLDVPRKGYLRWAISQPTSASRLARLPTSRASALLALPCNAR